MKIPQEIRDRYRRPGTVDVDLEIFLAEFDEPDGSSVLVLGAHDEPSTSMLADSRMVVTSVDLREYDQTPPRYNHRHIIGDFLTKPWAQWFNCFVSLSTVEHIGMGTYGDRRHRYGDVIAMRYAYDLLKPGGRAYITVPFGGEFKEIANHWRVYDLQSARERLVQDFELQQLSCAVAESVFVEHQKIDPGEPFRLDLILGNRIGLPNVSALLVLKKPEKE